jgi:hypothetical protein
LIGFLQYPQDALVEIVRHPLLGGLHQIVERVRLLLRERQARQAHQHDNE